MKAALFFTVIITLFMSCTQSKQSEVDKVFHLGWNHALGGYLLSDEPATDSTIAYHAGLAGEVNELSVHESSTAYFYGYKSAIKFIDSIEPYCEVDFDSAYEYGLAKFNNSKPHIHGKKVP